VEKKPNISPISQNHIDKNGVDLLISKLESQGIKDKKVLDVIRSIPRELFVKEELKKDSYDNRPLPIGYGQTISQPYIVAYMSEKLELSEKDIVLEVGTGSGYQTAVLAKLVKKVFTVEIIEHLGLEAKRRLSSLGLSNIFYKIGDGKKGWKEYSPFNKIIITAGAQKNVPDSILNQLAENGILIAPVGDSLQYLYIFKKENGKIKKYRDIPVSFVPLV